MDQQSFRRFGHAMVDWVADYMAAVETMPVSARVEPGDILRALPADPPAGPEPMERIFEDFQTTILPGMTHWQHPGWFAYFPANTSPPSVLAEILTAGLGAQCMSWATSPAATELEEAVLGWLGKMLGLPAGFTGVIQDTASTSTLVALLTARERATGFASGRDGMRRPLVVYASEEAHSSVEKAARIAGYGRENLRLVAADGAYAMIPAALERAVEEDAGRGLVPCCVVATVGTTSSTAVDPLDAIGDVCRARGLWLHVDAAYAGTAALLPEMRWILEGAWKADSLVVNPHKWMLTGFDCSAYFVRDSAALVRTFDVSPEYLRTAADDRVRNYRDWGIALGRRFRALKLWFVIRSYGVEGLRAVVREHLRLAGLFRAWVEEDRRFELMAPSPFGLVVFRLNDGRGEEALDALNRKLLALINAPGKVFLTHTTLRGRYAIRMSIGQAATAERHVRLAWDIISKAAADVLDPHPG